MSKPYIPTFEIVVRRSFDGQLEGQRTWVITGSGSDIDRLEDCIAFVADAAMDSIPNPLGPQGKNASTTGEQK